MEEKNQKHVATIKISDEQNKKIQEIADRENKSFNTVFNELIESGLERIRRK